MSRRPPSPNREPECAVKSDLDAADPPLIWISLDPPLPCGMPGCGAMARSALVEPDPQYTGAWLTLPLCPACRRRIAASEPGRRGGTQG
jgi:hypothetical protein